MQRVRSQAAQSRLRAREDPALDPDRPFVGEIFPDPIFNDCREISGINKLFSIKSCAHLRDPLRGRNRSPFRNAGIADFDGAGGIRKQVAEDFRELDGIVRSAGTMLGPVTGKHRKQA